MPYARTLLLAVCVALCGHALASPSGAQQIGRQQLWSILKPAIQTIPEQEFAAMFSEAPPPGAALSTHRYTTTINILGELYRVEVHGGNAVHAWTYAASEGFMGDDEFKCFILQVCLASVSLGPHPTQTGDLQFTFKDPFGSYVGRLTITGTTTFRASIPTGATGMGRGVGNPWSTMGGGSCTTAISGQGPTFESASAAETNGRARLSAASTVWAQAAPRCVPWLTFIDLTRSKAQAWSFAIDSAARRNLNPQSYVTIEGVEIVDDTPAPPDPNGPRDFDNDGIPDHEDPYPSDPTNTPPTNQWDVAPGDDETQCSIVNIPCNLRRLFVPQVDWPAEWQRMRDALGQKIPFAYINWLRDGSNAASGSDMLSEFCQPVQYEDLTMDWCNSQAMQWWRTSGVNVAFAILYLGYLTHVIARIRA